MRGALVGSPVGGGLLLPPLGGAMLLVTIVWSAMRSRPGVAFLLLLFAAWRRMQYAKDRAEWVRRHTSTRTDAKKLYATE